MVSSVIESDLVLEGTVKSSEGHIEIKGKVIGDIQAASVVVRGPGSTKGKLSAKTITIEGKHDGYLQCEDLTLGTQSEISSDITAKAVDAESGVKINGRLKITGG